MAVKFTARHLLTLNDSREVFSPGAIVYDESGIRYVGSPEGYRGAVDKEFVMPEGIIMPGLLNGHNHAAMSLMRGLADDSPFFEWLTEHVWPVEGRLEPEDMYWGTLLACAEMIRSGTVGFADMYFEVDKVAQAVEASGMRSWISRGLAESSEQKLAESVDFCRRWQGRGDGRIVTMLGPHAPYTCPPDFLEKVAEAAWQENLGIHIHLSESLDEMRQIRENYQRTPIQVAYDAGIFKSRTIIAHGVHIQEQDLPWLAGMRGGVVSCPVSNAKLGNGILPYQMLRDAGVAVGLGTDGPASTNSLDMFLEMKAMAWMQKVRDGKPEAFSAGNALWAATRGTAEILGHPGGRLTEGAPADFVVMDSRQPHMTPEWDVAANVVYSAAGQDVRYVVVNGAMLLQEGIITAFDEKAVIAEAEVRARRLMEG